tara:strand:+ start:4611 stop:5147 length:537 start_codon:yes stop_codon:yes gene_type:complete
MNLFDAEQLALRLMNEHGVNGWLFRWSNGKNQLGAVYCRRNRVTGEMTDKQLRLSRYLVKLNSDDEVRETILHEIAHILAGPENRHNWIWKQKCREIGCKPQRLAGPNVTTAPHSYEIVCGRCERSLAKRHRRPNSHKMLRQICNYCGIASRGMLRTERARPTKETTVRNLMQGTPAY